MRIPCKTIARDCSLDYNSGMERCVLIGGGDFCAARYDRKRYAYAIALDGGYRYVGADADAVVGDLDSLGYVPQGVWVDRRPAHKDYTDLEAGLRLAADKGYRSIDVFGVLGKRLDHSIAAIAACAAASCALDVRIVGMRETVYFVRDTLELKSDASRYLSLFAWQPTVVSASGLEYPVCDLRLDGQSAIGVSNEMTGDCVRICVASGCAIVVVQDKDAI